MSDYYEESFEDSFDSASDSDSAVIPEDREDLQSKNVTNFRTGFTSSGSSGGGLGTGLEVPRRDIHLLGVPVHLDYLSDHDQEEWK